MRRPISAQLVGDAGLPEVRRDAGSELRLRVANQMQRGLSPVRIDVSFAPLFADPDEQSKLRIDVPARWTARYEAHRGAWALAGPGLGPDEALEATVGGVRPDIPIGEALLPLVVSGGDEQPKRATIPLTVMPVAGPERDLLDALGARLVTRRTGGGIAAAEVAVTRRADEIERSDLSLWLYNRTGRGLVTAPWGPWPPTLTLVFDTAAGSPGHGALTTSRRLDDVEVVVERGTGWRVVKRSPGPEWDLVAVPLGGNREVMGAGTFTEILIRGIATDFAPGPTLVELRWHAFPGFGDGVRTFVVDKHSPPMRITRPLDANDLSVELGGDDDGTSIELTWKVEHASLIQLSGVGEVPTTSDGYRVTVTRDRVFVLTAYDAVLGEIQTDEIAITATTATREPLSTALLPAGAILAWEGAEIPDGFALCDGTRGTPDLSGRFVLGARRESKPGDAGGDKPHTHTFRPVRPAARIEPGGAHAHRPPEHWGTARVKSGFPMFKQQASRVRDANLHDATSKDGGHPHDVEALELTVDVAPGPAPWPRWYALAYIMKVYRPQAEASEPA